MAEDTPIDPTKVKYDNFFATFHKTRDSIPLDLTELAKDFPLDVEAEDTEEGLVITQNGQIVDKSHEVCSSTRKINKTRSYQPTGFTKLVYPTNATRVEWSKPQVIIPEGCWCYLCKQVGPFGHKNDCERPVSKSLRLTFYGFLNCCWNNSDKKVRDKIRNIKNDNVRNAVINYINLVEEIKEEDVIPNENIDFEAIKRMKEKLPNSYGYLISPESGMESIDDVLTNIGYSVVQNFSENNFFPGCIDLQYYNDEHQKMSVRLYTNMFNIISCPWTEKDEVYPRVIEKINESGQEFEYDSVTVKTCNGKFRLFATEAKKVVDLEIVYDYFFPTDETGNPIDNQDPKLTISTKRNDVVEKNSYIKLSEKILFRYEIKKPKRGKMSISFVRCEKSARSLECSSYKVTAQIYNSGIVQLIFSYVDKDTASASNKSFEKQLNLIENHFEEVRDLLDHHFKKLWDQDHDLLKNAEEKEDSKNIWNTISGSMPFRTLGYPYAGAVIERYDRSTSSWDTENRGYIIRRKKRKKSSNPGYFNSKENKGEINFEFEVIFTEPFQTRIVEDSWFLSPTTKKRKSPDNDHLPKIITEDGEEAYVLEKYMDEKKDYWVVVGKPELFSKSDFRVYKKKITDTKPQKESTTQVCPATNSNDKTPLRPYPYSFYGVCPGGKQQYVTRIGHKSRRDNRYYPCCVNVPQSKDPAELQERQIDFILNGLSDEDIKSGNIEVSFIHGAKIEDRFAGTLVPGTTDIGNDVTFWNGEEWVEGKIIANDKRHGVGNDMSGTNITVVSGPEGEEEKFVITGEELHPKHRESRNFPGLNKLVPDEKEQKKLLIECAKKLKLVKPEVNLQKVGSTVQTNILNKLGELTKFKTFEKITTNTIPFVSSYIKKLAQRAYVAAIIPSGTVPTLLFIIDPDQQFLINNENRVMKVDMQTELENTLIYGYTSSDRVFYPIDLLYEDGEKVEENYMNKNSNSGRLFRLSDLVRKIYREKTPNALQIKNPLGERIGAKPYIGPTDFEKPLMTFVKEKLDTNHELLFIPQIGRSSYMIWNTRPQGTKIVMKAWRTDDGELYPALWNPRKDAWFRMLKYPIKISREITDLKDRPVDKITSRDYIQFQLNIMTDGSINPNLPYVNIRKVPKSMQEQMVEGYDDTKIKVHSIVHAVNVETLLDDSIWMFPDIKVSFIAGDSNREPLVIS